MANRLKLTCQSCGLRPHKEKKYNALESSKTLHLGDKDNENITIPKAALRGLSAGTYYIPNFSRMTFAILKKASWV